MALERVVVVGSHSHPAPIDVSSDDRNLLRRKFQTTGSVEMVVMIGVVVEMVVVVAVVEIDLVEKTTLVDP